MRKFILTATVSLVFVVYIISQRQSSASLKLSPPPMLSNLPQTSFSNVPSSSPPSSGASGNGNPAPAQTQPPASRPSSSNPSSGKTAPVTQQNTGQYKDGTYVGSVADAYYGNVQVKVIVQGGRISDVQFLDYPQDRRTSQMINSQAMPYLTQEAIVAQSANVQIVSGATDTSQAFQQSLASALSQAI